MNIENEQKCINMALESAYAKGKKDAIEKACKWLETITSEEVIEEFREAMGE